MVLSGKTRSWGGESISRRDNKVEGEWIMVEAEYSAVPWQAQELGVEGAGMCSEICAQLRTWASCEVNSKCLCVRAENVGELDAHER